MFQNYEPENYLENPLSGRIIKRRGTTHKRLIRDGVLSDDDLEYEQLGGLSNPFAKKGKVISAPTEVKKAPLKTTAAASLIATAQINNDIYDIERDITRDGERISQIYANWNAKNPDQAAFNEVLQIFERRKENIKKLEKLRKEYMALTKFTF